MGDEVSAVAALVLDRRPTLGRSRLIAVDGPAGSGKTTFAASLNGELQALGQRLATVHLDDLYEGWSGLEAADLESRVREQLLHPLSEGRSGNWQRYDWEAQRLSEWHELPPPDVLIVDGCGSGALGFAPYITVLVWVEADRDTRIARGVERDGAEVLPRWLEWMESEARHFAAHGTRRRADLRYLTG